MRLSVALLLQLCLWLCLAFFIFVGRSRVFNPSMFAVLASLVYPALILYCLVLVGLMFWFQSRAENQPDGGVARRVRRPAGCIGCSALRW